MKTMLKVTLMMALLASTGISGDMGSGGFHGCTANCEPTIETVDKDTITTENVVLVVIKQYLGINF